MSIIKMFSAISFLAVAAGPIQDSRAPAPGWKAWLDAHAAGFSGVVLVGRDDVIEVEAAYGVADGAAKRPNDPGTRFNIGSINKTFTAVAIARLIQEGRLALDDTLAKHLPDYPNQAAASRITIRDLLTHQSGVATFMRADFGDATVAGMVQQVGAEPQVFEPGARQAYSNGGYIVLGRVIEVVSGRSYAAFVAEQVYRPAGMTLIGGNPAGGGHTTAADLFRFARALRAGRLLDPRMTEYVINGTFAEQPRWGFALREQVVGSHRFVGNGGGAPGVNAEFRFDASGAYTVVVLSNASPPAATDLLTAILNRIDGKAPAPAAAAPRADNALPRDPAGDLRAEVDALHAEMTAAFRDGPGRVAEYYTADARIMGGGRRFSGADQVRAYWSQVPPGASWALEIVDVGGSREEPWVLGRSTLGRPGGPGMSVDYLAVLRRSSDGRLRYHIDMFTSAVR